MFGWLDDWRADRTLAAREAAYARDVRCELRQRWREACERPSLQLSHGVATSVGMFPGRAPLIEDVDISPDGVPLRLVLRMPAGLLVEDLEDAGQELAAALCCHRLRFEGIGGPYVAATLVHEDPHAAVVEGIAMAPGSLVLGPDEYGEAMALVPARFPHAAFQGTTGGGKSTALYWLLRQLVRPDMGARITGIDPSGLLFRPLPADPWRVSGLRDPHRVVAVLEELVAELDTRCEAMPLDDDKLPCGPGTPWPWLFVVMEELPGLLVALDAIASALAKRARAALSRLAAEGRKVGFRLVMVAQRFDANSTAGATVRNNAGLRVSFTVENRAAIEFLHEGISPDLAESHTRALPGVSLVSVPGKMPVRVRWPVTSYQEWAADARYYSPPDELLAAA